MTTFARCTLALCTVCLLVCWTFSSPAFAAGGNESTGDGVPHIMNPAQSAEGPSTVKLEKLWQIQGDENDEFFFGVLTQIASDDRGNVYLLDAQLNEVMVFSPDGEYIRSIGREGEGPGEFIRPSDLFLTGSGNVAVMQRMPGKIVLLTPEGDPAGNHPVPVPEDGGMRMFSGGRLAGDHVVLSALKLARTDGGMNVTSSLIGVDESGKQTATYFTDETTRNFGTGVIDERTFGAAALVWNAGSDGRVYTSDAFDAYRFQVWNPNGSVERIVEREYEPRQRSAEEMERNKPRIMVRRGNRTQSPEVKASKTDRDIQEIFPRNDGSVWVLSSHGGFDAPDGTIGTFDVFDRDGIFASQLTLLGEGDYADDGFHIVGDRLFVVTGLRSARQAMFGGAAEGEEDIEDAEPMSVICYHLGPIVQTRK